MTPLAKQTVLINLEVSRSLDDLPWRTIQMIAQKKLYLYDEPEEYIVPCPSSLPRL